MKRSIRHLPIEKQNELNDIVSFVVETRSVEMIILFGSYARGDWVEDKYTENGITYEYKSDYDLLFVVEDEEKAHRHQVAKKLKRKIKRKVDLSASLNVIYHGIDYLNQEIEAGNYFFNDIIKEGIRLHHSKKYALSKPKKKLPREQTESAEHYYSKWIESAYVFEDFFNYGFEKGKLKEAVFLLHQAAERFCATVLLVFTGYKPKTHDLEDLINRICKQDARFKTVFPRQTKEEEELFILLKKAYIDSRYKIDYEIKKEELEYLSERVKLLKNLTEEICKEKIKVLKSGC